MHEGSIGVAWTKQTVLHPVEAAILIAMAIALLTCKRRYAVWPIIGLACFAVPSQRIVIGSLDFTLIRLITCVGMLRVIAFGESNHLRWNRLDTAMLAFTVVKAFFGLISDVPGDFVVRLGSGLDGFGMYILCRCLIRDWDDVFCTVRGFIWIGVIVSLFFVFEAQTHRNLFAAFGYVDEGALERQGRFRAQAAFAGPIIAGVFWSALMPLMVALAWQGRNAIWETLVGLIAASTICVCCASSTPFVGIMFAIVGVMMFPLRRSMRLVRWTLLIAFCIFQMVSDKPAWRILVRIDLVGGSTGYYRYMLMDQTIKHFSEWWLMGGNIDTTTWSPELRDDTNHFLVMALQGGLPLLTVFIISMAIAFGGIGRMWRAAGSNRAAVIASWALGISLCMHILSFFSITYFGQIVMLWNVTLAMIGSLMPGKVSKRAIKKRRLVRRSTTDKAGTAERPFATFPSSFQTSTRFPLCLPREQG